MTRESAWGLEKGRRKEEREGELTLMELFVEIVVWLGLDGGPHLLEF